MVLREGRVGKPKIGGEVDAPLQPWRSRGFAANAAKAALRVRSGPVSQDTVFPRVENRRLSPPGTQDRDKGS